MLQKFVLANSTYILFCYLRKLPERYTISPVKFIVDNVCHENSFGRNSNKNTWFKCIFTVVQFGRFGSESWLCWNEICWKWEYLLSLLQRILSMFVRRKFQHLACSLPNPPKSRYIFHGISCLRHNTRP